MPKSPSLIRPSELAKQQQTAPTPKPTPTYTARSNVSYWEDPANIALQYKAIQSLKPGAEPPVDRGLVEFAYKYFKKMYNDAPDYTWKPLPYNEPLSIELRKVPKPEVEKWWLIENQRPVIAAQPTIATQPTPIRLIVSKRNI